MVMGTARGNFEQRIADLEAELKKLKDGVATREIEKAAHRVRELCPNDQEHVWLPTELRHDTHDLYGSVRRFAKFACRCGARMQVNDT